MQLTKYKLVLISLISIALSSGCSGQLSFEELTSDKPSNLQLKTLSNEKMKYSISLLKQFESVERDYTDTLSFELFVDTFVPFEKGAGKVSVLKYTSPEPDLKKAWKKLTSDRMKVQGFRIYSEGSTNYIDRPAVYEHSTSVVSNRNVEEVNFLFRGDSSDIYLLNIQVDSEEGYPENLKELLFCAKSFKVLL